MPHHAQQLIQSLLKTADIKVNGQNPWDIQVRDERFRRMWRFYLLASAATFRARKNQLWQIVLSPSGVPGGYQSIR